MGIFDRLFGNKTEQNNFRKKGEEDQIGGERFIFTDLTAEDKETGLVWTRDAHIAGRSMNWDEANDYIMQLNRQRYAGYTDWRLPSKKELRVLVYYAFNQEIKDKIYQLFNKIGFKNVQSNYYWSSTSHAYDTTIAWDASMWNGGVGLNLKSYNYYVWPVRSGQ